MAMSERGKSVVCAIPEGVPSHHRIIVVCDRVLWIVWVVSGLPDGLILNNITSQVSILFNIA